MLELALVVLVAWIGAVGFLLYGVLGHVRSGQDAVSAAQAGLKASSVTDPNAADLLTPVRSQFGAARGELDNPLLGPLRVTPVVGRQLRAVRSLTAAAEQVAIIGQSTVSKARAALRSPHSRGPERVVALKALSTAASQADTELSKVSLGPDNALICLVRQRRNEFAVRLGKVQTSMHRGSVAAQAVTQLLNGPHHVLVLGANNAEMRNGSGMLLSATTADFANGNLHMGQVHDTGDLLLPPGAVANSGEFAKLWGFLHPTEEWRNLAVSPRFDVTAGIAAQMWKAKTGENVDGVLTLDLDALRGFLLAIGPVHVDGRTVTADSVLPLLLHDQYVGSGGADADNGARRDQLGHIASAVVGAAQGGSFDSGALASQLTRMVAGRHLMMWSPDPRQETAWRTAGVSGDLDADSLMVGVINRGGNKLDQYLNVSTDLDVRPGPTATAVTARVHLANVTPDGQPPYIAGTGAGGVPANVYRGFLTLALPRSARSITIDGEANAIVSGPDGPTQTVAVQRDVSQGASIDVVVQFLVPGAHGDLQVESAARIPAATVSVSGPTGLVAQRTDESRPLIAW